MPTVSVICPALFKTRGARSTGGIAPLTAQPGGSAGPAGPVLGAPSVPSGPPAQRTWQLGWAPAAAGTPVCRCVHTFQVNQHFKEGEHPPPHTHTQTIRTGGSSSLEHWEQRTWLVPSPRRGKLFQSDLNPQSRVNKSFLSTMAPVRRTLHTALPPGDFSSFGKPGPVKTGQ